MIMMRHFAITQQGASHITAGTNCQDYSASRSVSLKKANCTAVLCGISDGVGSCTFSEIGSVVAVTTSLDLIEKELVELETLTEENVMPLMKHAFESALDAIRVRADNDELPFVEFDATLTIALFVDDGRVFFGHIGDDGIVALYTDGTYEMVTHRHKGEEANSVCPLRFSHKWEFGSLVKETASIAMMTDGVLDRTVGMEQISNLVYLPMIKSALTYAMDGDEHATKLKEHWSNYLGSDEFRAKVTDDLTLVVAQRPEALPAEELIVFDEDEWNNRQEQERQRVRKVLEREHEEWLKEQKEKADDQIMGMQVEHGEDEVATFFSNADEVIAFTLVTADPSVSSENGNSSELSEAAENTDGFTTESTEYHPIEDQPVKTQIKVQKSHSAQKKAMKKTKPQILGVEETIFDSNIAAHTTTKDPPSTIRSHSCSASSSGTADSIRFIGHLGQRIVKEVKVAAQTLNNLGKSIGDQLLTDRQQRMDSVPVFFDQNGTTYVASKMLLQTDTNRFYSIEGNKHFMISRLNDRIINDMICSREDLVKRISALQKRRFNSMVENHDAFCWPVEILRNNQHKYVGYTVERLPEMIPIEVLWSDCTSDRTISRYTLKNRCGIAYRLACMVEMANKNGLYIYDFTPQHIVLQPKGYMTFTRMDTFCCTTEYGQCIAPITLPSRYLPPELLQIHNKHLHTSCSAKTDAFSLALIIYMILSRGKHPYDTGVDSDVTQNIINGNHVNFEHEFPSEVKKLFRAAFTYTPETACQANTIHERPNATEWMNILLDAFITLPA